jgi:predicted small secreted protein
MNKNSRSAAMLLLILTLSIVSACHTVAGVGKDTQEVGEAIEDSSGAD